MSKFILTASTLLLLLNPPVIGQIEYTDRWEDHLRLSTESIASETGTTFPALESFYEAISSTVSATLNARVDDCVGLLDDSTAARDEFILCLAGHGSGALNEDLFRAVFNEKIDRIKMEESHDDAEIRKTIVLLSWLEDLIREKLASTGKAVDFYVRDETGDGRFADLVGLENFEFEDGDVLLSIGGSSVSALIPLVTTPQRRFSHAFMMRVRDGEKVVLESLIKTGVKKTKFRKFIKHKPRHVLVMRLPRDVVKNPEIRSKIIGRASDICLRFAERKVRYDMAMDYSNTKRIFCSELVAACYTQAANEVLAEHPEEFDRDPEDGFAIEDLAGRFGKVRSHAVARFLYDLGVRRETMPSPGDLIASDHLTVVADYRATDNLFSGWVEFLTVHVVLDRLENGFEIRRRYTLLNQSVRWIFNLLRTGKRYITRPVGFEFGIIPEALSGKKLLSLKIYDREVFQELVLSYWGDVKERDDTPNQTLLRSPPWAVRAYLSLHAATSKQVLKALSPVEDLGH